MSSPKPDWYQDEADPRIERWWDGRQWTGAQRPLRKAVLWRFAWALFFVAAAIVVFLPIKETILGTDQNCGNAFAALNVEVKQEAIDAGIGDAAQNAVDQCHSDAHIRLLIGGILVLAGIGASISVRKWELSR